MLGFDDFFRSRDFLSVEFGSSSLKVARARPDGSSMRVDLADREAVDDLSDSNRVEKYTEAFRSILDRQSISGSRNVGLTLPTSGVIVRHLDLPAVSDERLSRVVQYEAESHIPFSVEDVVMDYHVAVRDEEETQIILVVVQKEKLDQYLDVIHNVGFEAELIEISSFSLFNLYQNFNKNTDASSGPQALVDVGSRSTDIIIFRGSRLYYARSASVAGDSVTEEIAQQLNVDLEQAEKLKVEHGHLPLDETDSSDRQEPPAPPGEEGSDGSEGSIEEPPPPPGAGDDSLPADDADDEGEREPDAEFSPSGGDTDAGLSEDLSLSEGDSEETEGSQPPPPPGEDTGEQPGTEEVESDVTGSDDLDLSLGDEESDDLESPDSLEEPGGSGSASGPEPPSPPAPETEEPESAEDPPEPPAESEETDEDDDDLDLGLGQLRTPEGDEESGDLEDPLSEEDDSSDESEDDEDSPSLGAAANEAPPPPEEPNYDPDALRSAVRSQVDRIIGELNQTFEYFRNEMDGEDVEEIILCGSGSKIRNFPAYVEEELDRSTRRFEPGARLKGLPDEETQSMLVALGLQLRTDPDRTTLGINLLPEEIVRRRQRRTRRRKMIANGVLAGVLLLQVVVWIFYSYQVRQAYFQKSEEQLREVQPVVQRVSELKEARSNLETRMQVVERLRNQQARILPLLYDLNQLEESLRERTWFETISYSSGSPNGTLRLQGVTGDFQDVSRIYQWLDDFEFTVTQVSENQNRQNYTLDGEDRSMVQFSVNYEVTFAPYNSETGESL